MIEQITLRDFKAHRETVVPLKPLTILAGPNGAGKTSVLEALYILGRLYVQRPAEVFDGRRDADALLRHVAGVTSFQLEARGRHDGAGRDLRLHAFREDDSAYTTDGEEVPWSKWYFERRLGREGKEDCVERHDDSLARQHGDHWTRLRHATLLRLDSARIAATSPADPYMRVARDGFGVATVLANMKLTNEERFHRVVRAVSAVIREVEAVRVVPDRLGTPSAPGVGGFRVSFDVRGGRDVPARSMSEGTLTTLALMTILEGESPPATVLLDDVDESLHPSAQLRLMTFLSQLSVGSDPVQIIATSHSPYILDCVEPEAVQVFALRDDGTVAVKCLADHPEAARSRGTLTAGQLWTLDDEHHWVIDGAA